MIDKQVMLNLIIDAKRNEPENVSSFSEWLAGVSYGAPS